MTALSIARREPKQQALLSENFSFVQGDFEIAIVSDGYITVPIDIVAPDGSPEERNDILTRTGNLKAGLVDLERVVADVELVNVERVAVGG